MKKKLLVCISVVVLMFILASCGKTTGQAIKISCLDGYQAAYDNCMANAEGQGLGAFEECHMNSMENFWNNPDEDCFESFDDIDMCFWTKGMENGYDDTLFSEAMDHCTDCRKEGNEDRIYKEGDYCIIAEYKEGSDPVKLGTKITYHIVGVM